MAVSERASGKEMYDYGCASLSDICVLYYPGYIFRNYFRIWETLLYACLWLGSEGAANIESLLFANLNRGKKGGEKKKILRISILSLPFLFFVCVCVFFFFSFLA